MSLYTVVEGDTLRDIARRKLGNENKWSSIWESNRDHLRSGNPDLIYPGEQLFIPPSTPKPPAPQPARATQDRTGLSDRQKNEVRLEVNGKVYGGWLSNRISRNLEAVSGAFTVGLTEKWDNTAEDPYKIQDGDEVSVSIGPDQLIKGYVDSLNISLDKDQRTISISGRDKTGDLVDCDATNRPGQWKNRPPLAIMKDLCSPFGINVNAKTDLGGSIPNFATERGESVFAAIERLARKRGFLMNSDPITGDLVVTKPSTQTIKDRLIENDNIIRIESSYSSKQRYSIYTCYGQQSGYKRSNKKEARGSLGSYKDDGVQRFRPKIINLEGAGSSSDAKKRAYWESVTRAARAETITVTVKGWRRPSDDELWSLNTLIYVESKACRVSRELLCCGIDYTVDDRAGKICVMDFKRPDAFLPEPETTLSDKDQVRKRRRKTRPSIKRKRPDPNRVTTTEFDTSGSGIT
jgi:prophage tail gpP-like protein